MREVPAEIVRSVYERWSQGDFSAGSGWFDEASTLVLNREFPDAGVYVGRTQIEGYMRSFLEPWEQLTITCVELTEAGDTLVAEVRQEGVGELSGAMTGFGYFQLWTFRGATVVRLQNVMTREQAEAAVEKG